VATKKQYGTENAKFEISTNFDGARANMENGIKKALTMMGIKNQEIVSLVITDMKAVDTGRLRSSMNYQVDLPKKVTVVGTNVEYAPYVHEGTRRMAARPFLRESITGYTDDYKEIVSDVLGDSFK
jgi:HK97 gp10 family phage protein